MNFNRFCHPMTQMDIRVLNLLILLLELPFKGDWLAPLKFMWPRLSPKSENLWELNTPSMITINAQSWKTLLAVCPNLLHVLHIIEMGNIQKFCDRFACPRRPLIRHWLTSPKWKTWYCLVSWYQGPFQHTTICQCVSFLIIHKKWKSANQDTWWYSSTYYRIPLSQGQEIWELLRLYNTYEFWKENLEDSPRKFILPSGDNFWCLMDPCFQIKDFLQP